MKKAGKKVITLSQALKKAADYCAVQERCQQEVRLKTLEWGLTETEAEQCVAELIGQGFINEERYAIAFAGGKFRMKKWGRVKIKTELRQKKISEYCINKGLREIDAASYNNTLKEILIRKSKDVKEKNQYRRMNKIAVHAIQKGYEQELVWDLIREIFT